MIADVRASVRKRWETICALLESGRRVSVAELVRQFHVSAVTIRRDLRLLEEAGKLIRTPGGAAHLREFSFAEKITRARPEKEAIGRVAAGLVKPGDSVILDSGSTTYFAARFLRGIQGITIVTNSVPPLLDLFDAHGIEVVVLGGVLNRTNGEFVGPAMRAGLEGVRASIALLGADGLTISRGAQTASVTAAESARILAEHAEQVVILADASKLGRDSFATYLEAARIHKVITAGEQDERARQECRLLRDIGAEVVEAAPAEQKGTET